MTTSDEREALLNELEELMGPNPGKDERALARVRRIVADLERSENAYVREKAAEVVEDFELWLSERRWQRYCDGISERFRVRLLTSISKLRNAFRD